jgi:hypothetical protein
MLKIGRCFQLPPWGIEGADLLNSLNVLNLLMIGEISFEWSEKQNVYEVKS